MATTTLTQDDKLLKEEFEAPFCRRDYELLEAYYPRILEQVERAVNRGVSPETVKRWAKGMLGEADSKWVQRVYNAARYVVSLKG